MLRWKASKPSSYPSQDNLGATGSSGQPPRGTTTPWNEQHRPYGSTIGASGALPAMEKAPKRVGGTNGITWPDIAELFSHLAHCAVLAMLGRLVPLIHQALIMLPILPPVEQADWYLMFG